MYKRQQVDYDIDIPEQPVRVRLDMDSYMRIVNNLIQNVIAHSHADKIKIVLSKKENNKMCIRDRRYQQRQTRRGIGKSPGVRRTDNVGEAFHP